MSELDPSVYKIAPCLLGGPLAEAGRRLVLAASALGDSPAAGVLKAWCVVVSFGNMEAAFRKTDMDPTPLITDTLFKLSEFLDAARMNLGPLFAFRFNRTSSLDTVLSFTAEHYGELFRAFAPESFWYEPAQLLRQRLERNGFDPEKIARGKTILDAGCGGGRYSVAWKSFGAREVIGLDASEKAIADARRRVNEAGLSGIEFIQGDVLRLPFKEDRFDVVFSNGVLHHTTDWKKGVRELVRVLKPGGFGWLYLIEKPGGLFWDVIEILRVVMRGTDPAVARNALYMIGIPANRVFYMLDHVLVPINERVTPREVEQCLEEAGATQIRRLKRGADFDRVEQIFRGDPYAKVKFGVGENRYVFTKR